MGICGRLPYNRRMARDRQLILNRYRPIGEAKAGGFGTVRVAWDTRIQRKVAIKCIELDEVDAARAALPGANAVAQRAPQHEPLPWEDDPVFNDADEAEGDATSVFDLVGDGPLVHSLAHVPGLDEARTAAMLSDASIVAVYDFEVQESTAYLIMEYVEGVTLTELLHRHADRLTLDVVAAVFASVSHALEVAHANQVLHLDIKPDNVLINHQGQVKVTDFGLATLADASGYGAAGGGTIGYMPLEQMRQENLDVRCDEWALASLTYEMLAGENPFLAPDLERAEAVIEDAELVLPSLCWDELDPAVDDVIFFALDPDREERYATVADFAEELEPFLGDPKRGVRELSVIVGHADDEEEEETETAPPVPYVPLRERITPLQRTVAAHAAGALGSGAVAFVAFANLPQTSGFANPLFWGLFALVTLAGALKPHLGALLAYFALSAAPIAGNAPAAGCVLLAATAAWWYFTGRLGDADANATLVPPLAGAFGCNQLTPLVAGFCLPPSNAAVRNAPSSSSRRHRARLQSSPALPACTVAISETPAKAAAFTAGKSSSPSSSHRMYSGERQRTACASPSRFGYPCKTSVHAPRSKPSARSSNRSSRTTVRCPAAPSTRARSRSSVVLPEDGAPASSRPSCKGTPARSRCSAQPRISRGMRTERLVTSRIVFSSPFLSTAVPPMPTRRLRPTEINPLRISSIWLYTE